MAARCWRGRSRRNDDGASGRPASPAIYIGESNRSGVPLYEAIVQRARERGLSGRRSCAASRASAPTRAFTAPRSCACRRTCRSWSRSSTEGTHRAFLAELEPMIEDGMVTLEDVKVLLYRRREADRRLMAPTSAGSCRASCRPPAGRACSPPPPAAEKPPELATVEVTAAPDAALLDGRRPDRAPGRSERHGRRAARRLSARHSGLPAFEPGRFRRASGGRLRGRFRVAGGGLDRPRGAESEAARRRLAGGRARATGRRPAASSVSPSNRPPPVRGSVSSSDRETPATVARSDSALGIDARDSSLTASS